MFQDVVVVEQPAPEPRLRGSPVTFLPRIFAALLATDDEDGAASALVFQCLERAHHDCLIKLLRDKITDRELLRGLVVFVPHAPEGRVFNDHIHLGRRNKVQRVVLGDGEALRAQMPQTATIHLIGRHLARRRFYEQRAIPRRRLIDCRVLPDPGQSGCQKSNGRRGAVGLLRHAGARPRSEDRLPLVEVNQRTEYFNVARSLGAHVLNGRARSSHRAQLDGLVNGLGRNGAGLYLLTKELSGLFPGLDNGIIGGSVTELVGEIL